MILLVSNESRDLEKMIPAPKTRPRGRPRSEAAEKAVMDAVYAFLEERSVRELTMEGIAERANVGKPTLYKWWPSKAALVMAVLQERLVPKAPKLEPGSAKTAEETIRGLMHRIVRAFNGMFGKVFADLIAEGQNDPGLLSDLYEKHLGQRRNALVAEIERGKQAGEFYPEVDAELLVDSLIGPIYYRLLMKTAPLTEAYVDQLITQLMLGKRKIAQKRSK
jgi:AcrR family transcriptional regulator